MRRVQDEYDLPPAVRRSARLHARVLEFARVVEGSSLAPRPEDDTFESLALDIARYQYDQSAGFARLVAAKNNRLSTLADLPLLPTDAFRYTRVAVHPAQLDAAVFRTSGTLGQSGTHGVRDLNTKEVLALKQARASLFSKHQRGTVVALAERPNTPPTSSLTHMMELFMHEFDGRSLAPDPTGAKFEAHAAGRWLAQPTGIDIEGLHRAARVATYRSEPLFLLSTSFALLAALEALDGQRVRTPARTTVMITGGFKGTRTNVSEEELRAFACEVLQVSPDDIVGEYGMTELCGQLFERPGTRRYQTPPWLRVQAVDPASHEPLAHGEIGLAHFIDLGNVDSCLSVLTQDLIRVTDEGVELLGRAERAVPRGCSLPYEGLVAGPSSSTPRRAGGLRD